MKETLNTSLTLEEAIETLTQHSFDPKTGRLSDIPEADRQKVADARDRVIAIDTSLRKCKLDRATFRFEYLWRLPPACLEDLPL